MRQFRGFLRRHAVDLGDLDQLRAARAFLIETVNPLAKAQVVFANSLGRDKDIVASLFEIFTRHAEETEALGREFEQTIGLDFFASELNGLPVLEMVADIGRAAIFAALAVGLTMGRRWRLSVLRLLALPVSAFALIAAAFAAAWHGACVVAVLKIALLTLVRRTFAAFLFLRLTRAWRTRLGKRGRLLGRLRARFCWLARGGATAAGDAAKTARGFLVHRSDAGFGRGWCSDRLGGDFFCTGGTHRAWCRSALHGSNG